jgi:hypothetical protein
MNIERPLPKVRQSRSIIIVIAFVVLTAASVAWSLIAGSLHPLWLIGAGVIAVLIAFYHRRRCPQCGRRLRFRAEPLPSQNYHHRILFDCSHCDVTLDSGEIQEEYVSA